jgi:hypothetical protein
MGQQQEISSLRPFTHSIIRTDLRLLILSTCTACGRGKLVSNLDGSLIGWETSHQCEKRPPSVHLPTVPLEKAG